MLDTIGRTAGRGAVDRPARCPDDAAIGVGGGARAPRRACASCSVPNTSSGCRSSGSCCSEPQGRRPRTTRAQWSRGFLSTRCLTIAGGTSEVQRNVIGERILGLPGTPSRE